MQLFRCYPSIRVLIYTTLVLLTIQQVAWAQDRSEVERLREEQMQIGCQLKYNETLRLEFFNSISNKSAIRRTSRHSDGFDENVRCWAVRYCPGSSLTSWCIHLYHPEKKIELCYNSSGDVTRITEAAAALMLWEKFQIVNETSSPEKRCQSSWPGCIRAIKPETFLAYSYLSCTAQSDTCYQKTYTIFEVYGNGAEYIKPAVAFSDDPANLFLNDTSVLQCNVSIPASTFLRGLRTGWIINGEELSSIPQHPRCDLNLPLNDSDSTDCQTLTEATAMLKQNRVRQYRLMYRKETCPYPIVLAMIWLVIEKTSLEDAAMMYECFGEYEVRNPVTATYHEEEALNLNLIYPLLEVIPVDRPVIPTGSDTYHPEPGETLQWNCSVQAGLGDALVWRLNGEDLHHIEMNDSFSAEDLNCSSLLETYSSGSVAITETKELGQYKRLFSSTLHICQPTAGFYECVVLRSRGEERDVRVWSTTVGISSVFPTPSQEGGPKHLEIIISVSVVTSFILVVFVLVTMITFCIRYHQQRSKPSHAVWELAMGNISVTNDILTEFRRKSSLQKDFLDQEDAMEFPRNRLILLDKVLGEGTFGLVRQARAEGIVESTPERNIVAVKTTRAKAPPEEINNFWEELQLMKNMVPHGNIVNLLGHCTTPGGPTYMIIEYANHGSLKDFLKKCEEAVLKLNHIPQVQRSFRSHRTSSSNSSSSTYPHLVFKLPLSAQNSVFSSGGTPTTLIPSSSSSRFDFSSTNHDISRQERMVTQDSGFFGENVDQAAFGEGSDGALMAHTVAPLTHDYVNSKGLLYMEDVQNFALQIACGLKHLEDIQIVHCDLAARNILIAEGFVLKIGDFGMARDVSEKEYYRKQGGRVPVKWTAPEALTDHIFTFKSDIWSYGVILWEIFTYGQQPYPKFKIRHSWDPFINYLMEGNRLEQPKGCPDSLYTLMQSCWHSSPSQRPTADDLVQLLSQTNLLCEGSETDGISVSDSGTQLNMEPPVAVAYSQETQV